MSTYGNNYGNDEITAFVLENLTEEVMQKFNELMQNPAERKFNERLKLEYAEALYQKAKEIQERLKDENLSDKEREELEILFIHLVAAIKDVEQTNEKEREC